MAMAAAAAEAAANAEKEAAAAAVAMTAAAAAEATATEDFRPGQGTTLTARDARAMREAAIAVETVATIAEKEMAVVAEQVRTSRARALVNAKRPSGGASWHERPFSRMDLLCVAEAEAAAKALLSLDAAEAASKRVPQVVEADIPAEVPAVVSGDGAEGAMESAQLATVAPAEAMDVGEQRASRAARDRARAAWLAEQRKPTWEAPAWRNGRDAESRKRQRSGSA